jgi:hypothetical protein
VNELWTVKQVAEHFGVSESRARALMAEYGIQRVSGYPADQVRQVQRPGQGRRTDLGRRNPNA